MQYEFDDRYCWYVNITSGTARSSSIFSSLITLLGLQIFKSVMRTCLIYTIPGIGTLNIHGYCLGQLNTLKILAIQLMNLPPSQPLRQRSLIRPCIVMCNPPSSFRQPYLLPFYNACHYIPLEHQIPLRLLSLSFP